MNKVLYVSLISSKDLGLVVDGLRLLLVEVFPQVNLLEETTANCLLYYNSQMIWKHDHLFWLESVLPKCHIEAVKCVKAMLSSVVCFLRIQGKLLFSIFWFISERIYKSKL